MPTQQALQQLHAATLARLSAEVEGYHAGLLTPREFGDRLAQALEDGHTLAVVYGRQRAGDTAPEEADDRQFARVIMRGEREFLTQFVGDLEAGRYDEAPEAVGRRASLYGYRLAGTANEALVLASDETRWWWELGIGSGEHCEECPQLAAGSPYERLERVPGDNSTACVFRCRCSLRREDGLSGFVVPAGG